MIAHLFSNLFFTQLLSLLIHTYVRVFIYLVADLVSYKYLTNYLFSYSSTWCAVSFELYCCYMPMRIF